MKSVEQKISPLIQSMFPSYYQEDGQNFILFVQAYFEWLESNHQLLTLDDAENFNTGDTVVQEDITGKVIYVEGNDILVFVDDSKTFKCYNVCSELIPITSSSGGNSYILKGGTSKRLGPVFWARNLVDMRDIDTTLDLFIVRFKEKYLKNIEFDVQTNKELLIKNALNLYRSKGTERSIDLFFRLVYGTNAAVKYPGDDLFRLSDGEWVKPRYLEITSSSVERAISLVGKQITGVTSGATAFVEKYIKRKIKNGFVHMLYLSNITGEFINREVLISDTMHPDSPKVVGSLSFVTITQGSKEFKVGDIVSFNSVRGDYGLARVAEVVSETGIVDFLFLDGGYGYTVSTDTSYSEAELAKRTQSIISEKVLALSNVITSNAVSEILISSGGTGYKNTDTIRISSPIANATASLVTNATGGIQFVAISNNGAGFLTTNPTVAIINSTGGATSGTGAVLSANATEQDSYFEYFESVRQPLVKLDYNAASNATAFTVGSTVTLGNSTVNAVGVILESSNTYANVGNLTISIANNGIFGTIGNAVILTTNSSVNAVINAVTNTTATGVVMGVPNTAIFTLSSINDGSFELGDVVFQVAANNLQTGSATIIDVSVAGTTGTIEVEQLQGVIRSNRTLHVNGKTTTAKVDGVQLNVGLYGITNNFTNTYSATVFSTRTGTTANVSLIGSGYGASFKVGTIAESETVYLNSDLLNANNKPVSGANQAYMTLPISATTYGFPKNPMGNSSAVIFSCLTFDSFTIGTIGTLEQINPGIDYNIDPFVLAYQPYITGFNRRDYVFNIADQTGTFITGERILQTNTTIQRTALVVTEEAGFEVGDTVYQTNATSNSAVATIDSITPSSNTITVVGANGTFVVTAGTNSSLRSTSSAQTALVYTSATNNQLYINGSDVFLGTRVDINANSTYVTVASGGAPGHIIVGTVDAARFSNNDPVLYFVPPTNTAITGLTSNSTYYIRSVNSTAIQLANSVGGDVFLESVGSGVQKHQLIKINAFAAVRNNANSTLANANGTMYIKVANGYIRTTDTIYSTANLEVQANASTWSNSSLSTPILSTNSASYVSTAKGVVKDASGSTLSVKRIQFENLFTANSYIEGSQSGARARIVSLYEDDVLPIGLNARIEANVATAEGAVTSLQVIDSGAGYANGEDIFFLSEDKSRSGKARVTINGIGTGSGYYKTSRGFLSSSTSKVHDGDYYQEYSYEVMSRIPFDRYKDMFKKVLHTAGTRLFGSVVVEELMDETITSVADSALSTLAVNTVSFTSANVVANSIVLPNAYANSVLIFKTGDQVSYNTTSNSTPVDNMANNGSYFVVASNSTTVSIATSPRAFTYTFSGDDLVGSFIPLTRHNFVVNDAITYTTSNTALTGLSNNQTYHVVSANSTGITVSATRGGTAITPTGLGTHTLTTTIPLNISAPSNANQHFIRHVNQV